MSRIPTREPSKTVGVLAREVQSAARTTEAPACCIASNLRMSIAGQIAIEKSKGSIPSTMQAAVYRGVNDVRLETVPVPAIGPGELLVRVHTCGVCGTDLKKIATGSHSAPRIFRHATSGVVAAAGVGVRKFDVGDRVMVFHHIPCRQCYYCRNKTFAQCIAYKK